MHCGTDTFYSMYVINTSGWKTSTLVEIQSLDNIYKTVVRDTLHRVTVPTVRHITLD
jgi:hypothetical protein